MEKIFDWGLLLKFKKVYVGCVEAIVCLKIVLKVFIFTLKVLVFLDNKIRLFLKALI